MADEKQRRALQLITDKKLRKDYVSKIDTEVKKFEKSKKFYAFVN